MLLVRLWEALQEIRRVGERLHRVEWREVTIVFSDVEMAAASFYSPPPADT
jgi:class 3 adenylate cyclase